MARKKTDKLPWLKWYPADWRSDPCLRRCSLAARGLWIEMLGIMHDAERYGHLVVGKTPVTSDALAAIVGASSDQVSALLQELDEAGVFSRSRDGVIYSRRMTRDEKRRETGKKHGKKGGNPSLVNGGNKSEIPPRDNPPDNPTLKAKRLEARGQRPELASSAPVDLSFLDACIDALGKAADPTSTGWNMVQLVQWREAGCSEAHILAWLRARAETLKPYSVRHFGYFRDGPVQALSDPPRQPRREKTAGEKLEALRRKEAMKRAATGTGG